MNLFNRKGFRIGLPFAVLALGLLIAVVMIRARPAVETRQRETPPPLVRVMTVRARDVRLTVATQGTVMPRTESSLVPEVSGRVLSISPSFAAGGFFEQGDILLTIEPADYRAAAASARALVTQAELRLAREEEEAAIARRDWERLGEGEATPLTLREPQVADARASLAAAEAGLARADRDLERTRLRAPFAGRVRRKNVDVGQVVTRGAPIGVIYATDLAEIRLPLPDAELAHLEIPLGYRETRADGGGDGGRDGGGEGGADDDGTPEVILRGTFAGRQHRWIGHIVRTEGELDPHSRMVHVVAQVEDPYGHRADAPDQPPLAVGLFVEAEILGRLVENVVVIPRSALRGRDQVLVAHDDDTLHFRTVDIVKLDRESAIIGAGLDDGDRVCLSPLDAPVEGMQVRTLEESTPPEDTL